MSLSLTPVARTARRGLRLAALAAVGIVASACGSTPSTTPQPTPSGAPRVVVDTDMSWDDIAALSYLLVDRDIRVSAITVAGTGVTRCVPGVAHVRELLAYLRHPPVPVACGPAQPLAGSDSFPATWRNTADGFFGLRLPTVATPSPQRARTATQVLTSVLQESPKATVIELAPMTNLAAALLAHPSLRRRIRHLYAMGGAVDVPGNELRYQRAEWNLWVDPEAADVVLHSGVPVTLVPLDACDDVPVTSLFYRALSVREHPGASEVVDLLLSDSYYLSGSQYFWDPAAALVATDPQLATLHTERVTVNQATGPDRGRLQRSPTGALVRVATHIDPGRFSSRYLQGLTGDPKAVVALPPTHLRLQLSGSRWTVSRALRPPFRFAALTITSDSPAPVTVVVGEVASGHDVTDVLAALERPITRIPDWFHLELQVQVPAGHPATWGVRLQPGLTVILGGGPHLAPRLLSALRIPN